ncbi:MAG: hypothetical protein CVU57_24410 [Deltaproteobacteria bacterium HGW-Deltaproteobacteria-15]|nr:MAG: hypothetical protein CVU57_24410 [Deltaproteobacteria bacterium HGW-Deltaproteobacteria-15]
MDLVGDTAGFPRRDILFQPLISQSVEEKLPMFTQPLIAKPFSLHQPQTLSPDFDIERLPGG